MGLAADLGYEQNQQNLLQRWIIALVSTRPMSAVNRRVLPSIDRWVLRLTGGRSTMTSLGSGLPVIWLSTIGAKSKERRTVPLLAFPVAGHLAILGTHFGSQSTPGWVHNLEAEPTAEVEYRERTARVKARRADQDESAVVWDLAATAYPGYRHYAGRAAHRVIRVFVLESAGVD
jgi:deazaflavin-dependent oxidoreductase (nitroreductase family)